MATIRVGEDGATVHQIKAPGQRKAELLGRIPQEQLLCRSTGRHRFPGDELDPSKAQDLPRGMTARMVKGGYQIIEECERGCGKVRKYTTRSGALWDVETTYAYNTPDEWVVISQDERTELDITATDFKMEKHRRNAQLIIAAARRARAVEKAEAARRQASVKFSGTAG